MACWMVHFRIADGLLDYIQNKNKQQFIVGNIGADCGEPNQDWSKFTPPSTISHWSNTDEKMSIDYERFYDTYLKNNIDDTKTFFYVGYYTHLITDVLWIEKILKPTKQRFKNEFDKDNEFIWKVKEDWYDLDHLFLYEHPNFRTFKIFNKIEHFPNVYLDYFSATAIENKIKYISNFYNTQNKNLDRQYIYLSKIEMNHFVDETVEYLIDILKEKHII